SPFGFRVALRSGDIPECVDWPDASPPPAPAAPLPAVPALIFSGDQDLRTPRANAAGVAARIPSAHLELVPGTGHSVIGNTLSSCPDSASRAFFSGRPVAPCRRGGFDAFVARAAYFPTRIAPLHLSHVAGRTLPRRTLTAVGLTLGDVTHEFLADVAE